MKKSIRVILKGLRFGILPGGTGVPAIGHARMEVSSRKGLPVRPGHAARLLLTLVLFLTLPAVVQAQFTFITNNGALTVTGYTGPGGAVDIPSTINGLPVTSVGYSAFEHCTDLSSVKRGTRGHVGGLRE